MLVAFYLNNNQLRNINLKIIFRLLANRKKIVNRKLKIKNCKSKTVNQLSVVLKKNTKIQKQKFNTNFYAYLSAWLSIATNLVLFLLKLWVGLLTNSVAIIADAWHTLSDSISSIIILVGIKISEKKANKKYPFGFGRVDIIASIILGILLSVVGFEFMIKGIKSLLNKDVANFGWLAIVVTIISILVKEAMAQFSFWSAKKTGKKSLKADAWHHRSDALSSLLILIGIFISKYFWWIDGLLGIILALIIFYTAFEILKDNILSFLGESPDDKLIGKLKIIANKEAKFDTALHHVHIHNYGNHTEITFHIVLPAKMTIEQAHKITENIEQQISNELDMIATIHIDPLS